MVVAMLADGSVKPDRISRPLSMPRRDVIAKPWRIVIIAGARTGEWGKFSTIEQAAEVAAKLRRHGMHAVVEEVAT